MTSIDASKFDDRLKKLGLPHDAFDRPGCSRLFAFHDYHGFAKLVQMPRLKKAEPSSLANLVSSYKNFNDVPTTDVITCVARSLAGLASPRRLGSLHRPSFVVIISLFGIAYYSLL